MDLRKLKKVHIVGIKGSGVSAVAALLKRRGVTVSGSDTAEKFFTDEVLNQEHIFYNESFSPANIKNDVDAVVYSTAYNEKTNVELEAAKKRNIPLISYPEMLGLLSKNALTIAVCGTHGKTTTSALLAYTMRENGSDPSAVFGSKIINWDANVLFGKGAHFVIEADEYQNKFRHYHPWAVILTNIDWDHPDYFKNLGAYKKVFSDFVARIPRHGFLVYCEDDADAVEVARNARCQKASYGFHREADFAITNYQLPTLPTGRQVTNNFLGKFTSTFEIAHKNKAPVKFSLLIPGKHNAANAAAVFAASSLMRLDMQKVKEALAGFKGTVRRFEYCGEHNGAPVIDDYAHHPEEIKAVLATALQYYPRKNIVAVFHPHSFSRTEALLDEFAASFGDADEVIVLDIYGSAREKEGNVHSRDLVDLINKHGSDKGRYIADIPGAVAYLKNRISASNVVLTLGAGNVWEVARELTQPSKK